MTQNSPNKIGEIAESQKASVAGHPPSKDLSKDREGFIVGLADQDREYWRLRNPLLGYRRPDPIDKAAAAILHVQNLIQHRIDRGEKYFTEQSKHIDLLEMRSIVVAHFKSKGIDLTIKRGGYIFVCHRGCSQ